MAAKYLIMAVAALVFTGCDDSLSVSQYDDVDVHAYFYTPDEQEVYLGQFHGASGCGDAARSYANQNGVSDATWGYVCCTIRKGSDCYEKIR